MNPETPYKALSKKELKAAYNISYKTLRKWLVLVPDLGNYAGGKFSPKQIEKIYKHHGSPSL